LFPTAKKKPEPKLSAPTAFTYLLTPWSRVLQKLTGFAASQAIPRIYGTRSSLPNSQVPATCPYPEPAPSSPHKPLPLPEDPSYYYPPIYVWVLLTYLRTPWSRILLKKLTGFAASQASPRIYRTQKFITVLTSARHPSLSSARFIQSTQTPSHFLSTDGLYSTKWVDKKQRPPSPIYSPTNQVRYLT
jgi:hypothetical protein